MTPRSRHPPAVQYPLQRSAVLGALLVFWLLGSAMGLAAWGGVGGGGRGGGVARVLAAGQRHGPCGLGGVGGAVCMGSGLDRRWPVAAGAVRCIAFLARPVLRADPLGWPGLGVGDEQARGDFMATFRAARVSFGHANAVVAVRASDGTAPHLAVAGAIEPARALARSAPCGIFARQTGHRQC